MNIATDSPIYLFLVGISGYVVAINLITFVLYSMDKSKAMKGRWRIPEAHLIGLAICGGSVGALLGMLLFRHKTKHPKFYLGLPLILLVQIALVVYLCIELTR